MVRISQYSDRKNITKYNLENSSLPAAPKIEKRPFLNYVEKICNVVDFNHKYYTKSYMINTSTFQAHMTLPVEFQNNKVVNTVTLKTSNNFCINFCVL